MAGVRFTSILTSKWTPQTEDNLDEAVLDMATDIHRESGIKTAKDTRALVNSGRIERVRKAHYKVIYGGGAVPYARRRHYENFKTPSSLGYLEKPGDLISRNVKKYLRKI